MITIKLQQRETTDTDDKLSTLKQEQIEMSEKNVRLRYTDLKIIITFSFAQK